MRMRVQAMLIFCKCGPEDQFRSKTRSLTGRVVVLSEAWWYLNGQSVTSFTIDPSKQTG